MRLGFVTNNAARTPETVAAHLTELDIRAEPADVITSSQAAASVVAELFGPGARVLPVGGPGVAAALRGSGPHRGRGRRRRNRSPSSRGTGRRSAGPSCPRPSSPSATARGTWPPTPTRPSRRRAARCPATARWSTSSARSPGRQPLVTGKPDPAMHAECVRRTDARRPLVVGDRLDTDIEGARRAGRGEPARLHGRHRPGRAARGRPRRASRPALPRLRRAAGAAPGGDLGERVVAVRHVVGRPGRGRRRRSCSPAPARRRPTTPTASTGCGRCAWRTGPAIPDEGAPATVVAGDERAAGVLAEWGLGPSLRLRAACAAAAGRAGPPRA